MLGVPKIVLARRWLRHERDHGRGQPVIWWGQERYMIEGGRRLHAQQDLPQQVTGLPLRDRFGHPDSKYGGEPFPTLWWWDAAKSAKIIAEEVLLRRLDPTVAPFVLIEPC
jgi:hypothetical protein